MQHLALACRDGAVLTPIVHAVAERLLMARPSSTYCSIDNGRCLKVHGGQNHLLPLSFPFWQRNAPAYREAPADDYKPIDYSGSVLQAALAKVTNLSTL